MCPSDSNRLDLVERDFVTRQIIATRCHLAGQQKYKGVGVEVSSSVRGQSRMLFKA
jgi:hypothetical protein